MEVVLIHGRRKDAGPEGAVEEDSVRLGVRKVVYRQRRARTGTTRIVLEDEIANVRRDKEGAIEGQQFEKAAKLRDKEKELLNRKTAKEAEARAEGIDFFDEVDEEAIAEVLAMWTGIPVYKLTEEETAKLLRMEEELHKRYVSQEDAVKAVSQSIRRTRAGLKDPKRPSGSFIFLGPSGVGKTELAKTLAETLFDTEAAMVRIDMSEYMEKHSVARMIGAPPGYVGYEEAGQLTEAVRRRPYAVVLFDEVEKAHAEVLNVLLQLLDDGRLTDGKGRTVDFKNAVVIMTSNLGSHHIAEHSGDLSEGVRRQVTEALREHFRPEFLNRVDEIIFFHALGIDHMKQIIDIQIHGLLKRLEDRKIRVELSDEAKRYIVSEGYDPMYGARPLKRTIQRRVLDPLAMQVLEGEFREGDRILVDVGDNGLVFEKATRTATARRAAAST